jgi:hypothetical protein
VSRIIQACCSATTSMTLPCRTRRPSPKMERIHRSLVRSNSSPLPAPRLTSSLIGANVVVTWVSPAPGFVLQQAGRLPARSNDWEDVPASPALVGESNAVVLATIVNPSNQFYRTRPR